MPKKQTSGRDMVTGAPEWSQQARDHLLRIPGSPVLTMLHATVDDPSSMAAHRHCHQHAVWHAVLATKGQGSFLIDHEEIEVQPPMLFLIPPHLPHSFQTLPGQPVTYCELTFASAGQSPFSSWQELLTAWTGIDVEAPVTTQVDAGFSATFRAIINDLTHLVRSQPQHLPELLQAVMMQALLSIWRHVLQRSGGTEDGLEQARRHLDAHLTHSHSLDELAQIADCSAKHFGRAFKKRYGYSPLQYRKRQLMQRAAILLRSSSRSLQDIAQSCGFDDEHYFNRCFSAVHGLPPGRYRRQANSDLGLPA